MIAGNMFGGKTEELLRRLKRVHIAQQRYQLFKPSLDTRYSVDHVQSHDSNRMPSTAVHKSEDILRLVDDLTQVVGIDEVQFFDEGIVDVVQKLANRGVRVICAGLDMDYRGKPFGPMPSLLCIAEEVTKLHAVCTICGGKAPRTQRLSSASKEQVLLGGKDLYEPRCRMRHQIPSEDEVTQTFNQSIK